MSSPSCRSSGLIVADGLVHKGRCKLISVHGVNYGLTAVGGPSTEAISIVLYDNGTAGSGKIVASMTLNMSDTGMGSVGQSYEFDMHGIICTNGLWADVTIPAAVAGTTGFLSGFTVEFA